MNDLTFGNMLAGNNKTILPSGAGAALFQTSLVRTTGTNQGGKNGALDITVVFNLPNQLNNSGHSLSITFGPNSAMWANGSNINGAKSFDPTQQQQLKLKKNKDTYIWLGGTVNSSLSQWSGKYSNVITITVNALNN
ncbi:MAG TPA: hypothetical protein VKA34_18980 [Balneolales bacterium]|nr:hypothetical protein [Balneolales bacterium]